MACSLARALDVAGEWWTPMILRDVWLAVRRFDQIQANLGLSRKVLADRLDTLVREEVVERRPYQERPLRHEYFLTQKGEELMQAFFVLLAWGDRWTAEEVGPPMHVRHTRCGELTQARVTCACCGEPIRPDELRVEPGPGARIGRGTRAVDVVLGDPAER